MSRRCRAPSMRSPSGHVSRCERPRGHKGRHAITEDGHRYQWGPDGRDESERPGQQVKLRLSPTMIGMLEHLGKRWQLQRGATVARALLEALSREST